MLENKEQEKIAGIISDFFDGAVNEADIDILAMKIYEKYVAKLEQDLEFTTKTANELIEIKHKLEQELAELKEKYIIPKFQLGQTIFTPNKPKDCVYELKIVSIHIERSEFYDRKFNSLVYLAERIKDGYIGGYSETELFATEQEAQAKLKEIQGNE